MQRHSHFDLEIVRFGSVGGCLLGTCIGKKGTRAESAGCTPVIPLLGKLRWEGHTSEAILNYIVYLLLKNSGLLHSAAQPAGSRRLLELFILIIRWAQPLHSKVPVLPVHGTLPLSCSS